MEILPIILIFAGLIIVLVGGVMFLVAAFRESIWWGLACLFIPIVQLFFLIVHWPDAKKSFFIQLFGLALLIAAVLISPQTFRR